MQYTALTTNEVYHVFSKSIANFRIFNNDYEFIRMQRILKYYQIEKPQLKFSRYVLTKEEEFKNLSACLIGTFRQEDKLVDIVAHCIMTTHIHLILKQLKDNGISIFMSNVFNSYTRYFNIRYKRKGPLWETRFKRVLVKTDEQLLHLTRYVHLNPVTAYLVDNPEQWPFSSYNEYLGKSDGKICDFDKLLNIEPNTYQNFVEKNIDYQRKLAGIKDLIIDQDSTS